MGKHLKTEVENRLVYIKDYIVYFFIFLFILYFHRNLSFLTGDDVHFHEAINRMSLINFLDRRYFEWSSRLIIEGILVKIILLNPWIWRIIDSFLIVLLIANINRLFVKNHNHNSLTIIFTFILMIYFPLQYIYGTSNAAITINYIWPLSLFIFSLLSLKKINNGQKIAWYEIILYTIAQIIATNMEIIAVISIGVNLLFLAYFYYKRKRTGFIYSNIFISIMNLLFALLSPGNDVRTRTEIIRWFPDFNMLNSIDKLHFETVETLAVFFRWPNYILVILCILVFINIWSKKNMSLWYALCALCPIATSLWLTKYNVQIVPTKYDAVPFLTKDLLTLQNFDVIQSYIPLLVLLITVALLSVSLYAVFGESKETILVYLILAIGICSRKVMAFSPTLYASGGRTFLFLYVCIIIITIMVWSKTTDIMKRSEKVVLFTIMALFCIKIAMSFPF